MNQPRGHDVSRYWRGAVDARLARIASGFGIASPALGRAMADAALAPGKRFRALVLLTAGEATGDVKPALVDAACAIELVHTASLIFDDLPCMDDAKTRRGRPTAHLVHGECRAVLAGIALVTEAMRLLATLRGEDAGTRTQLVEVLAHALGPAGLSAGQELDLYAPKDVAEVRREQDLKTGSLFSAGFEMLGIIQRLREPQMAAFAALGRTLGRAFQSYDDLLALQGEAAVLGKDVGRDAAGSGPARGVLAVRSLSQAEAHYETLRAEVDALLASCGCDYFALAAHIATVLPPRIRPAA